MDTIYSLLKRAKELKENSQVDSITPEEVGKLHEDTLAYIASLEQSADGLGIKKVYQSKSAMEADTDPVGTNGKTLRYGQLVSIYDDAHADGSENGNIYAYQKPGWLLMGKVSGGSTISIAQEAGDSATKVMSQKAVTEALKNISLTTDDGKTLQDVYEKDKYLSNQIDAVKKDIYREVEVEQQTIQSIDNTFISETQEKGKSNDFIVDIYQIEKASTYIIRGKSRGNITIIAETDDVSLNNIKPILVKNNGGDKVDNINYQLTANGTFLAITHDKSNAIKVYKSTFVSKSRIDELQERVNSVTDIKKDIVNLKRNVFLLRRDKQDIIEKDTKHYIDEKGSIKTITGWMLHKYKLLQGITYRLIGRTRGAISVAVLSEEKDFLSIEKVLLEHRNADVYDDVDIEFVVEKDLYLAVTLEEGKEDYLTLYSIGLTEKLVTDKLAEDIEDVRHDVDIINGRAQTIVCWGDSLTQGAGSAGNPYPKMLKDLLGDRFIVINAGVGGEVTNTIAARQGSLPMRLTTAVTLPSDTSRTPLNISTVNGDVRPLLQGGENTINPCYLDGEKCVMTYDDGKYYIQRAEPSEKARTIPMSTAIVTNYAKMYKKPDILILWVGTNGTFQNVDEYIKQIDRMIRFSSAQKYLIIGMHGAPSRYMTSTELKPYEDAMEEHYGLNFLNWRLYASSNAIYDAGITPNSESLSDMKNGYVPRQLRSDLIHLNVQGYTILSKKIKSRLEELGMIE